MHYDCNYILVDFLEMRGMLKEKTEKANRIYLKKALQIKDTNQKCIIFLKGYRFQGMRKTLKSL